MIALIVVALGAVAAAVGTGVLAARSTRRPRVYFVAWTIALFGLAVGLGAATLGYLAGYGAMIFRAMELGAQLIAPLSLCIALVEIVGRGLGARFTMRLVVGGIAVIALVVLGTDPINPGVAFSTTWPDPSSYYQIAPLTVLGFIALFTTATAAIAVPVILTRSSREQLPHAEKASALYLAVAAFLVVLPGLAWLAKKSLGIEPPLPDKDIFAACCVLAVALTWYAAKIAGDRDLSPAGLEAAASRPADDPWDDDGRRYVYETDEFDRYGSVDRAGGSHRGGPDYRPDQDYGRVNVAEPDSEIRYPGLAALAAGPAEQADDLSRYGRAGRPGESGPYGEADGRHHDKRRSSTPSDDDPQAQLFGQITIYTLLEGRVEDFDRLTEWVVGQVRSKEPDTLVYIVHAVPTAPLQRILYEVYRNRAAHEEHSRRRYVMTYQAEQRSFVLTTNVIELGLKQAKVSPLPSISAISDILSESGIDLTGITRSSQASREAQPRHQPQYERPPDYDPQDQYDRRPRYEPQPGYEAPYQGWADIRREDSRY